MWSNGTYRKNGADVWRGYRFSYDGLDRMTDAMYGEGASLADKANRYDESIPCYNADGAIERLQRRGRKQDGIYGKIDNLNIQLEGNRIVKVTDDAEPLAYHGAVDFVDGADTDVEYTYDGNGNLTSDANKGIALIEYDGMNMPRRIQFTNGNVIEYTYTAGGQKLRTTYYTAVPNISVPMHTAHVLTDAETLCRDSTEYLFGGLLTMRNGTLDRYIFDGGYFSFDNSGTPSCHYYNRDHLGNIREVISETGAIEQVTHYYPFGTPYSDSSVTNPALQPYKYNGKEFDAMHGLNTYDYGARQYDPLLAVWHGVDPLCEKDYGTGATVYCRNNPIVAIDIDGREVHPSDSDAYVTLLNTISPDDRQYVVLNKQGNIDVTCMQSHISNSGNYASLMELVNSDIMFNISIQANYDIKDNYGNITPQSLSYCAPHEDFIDVDFLSPSGLTTGETGRYGISLLPGFGSSGINSINQDAYIYIHPSLSTIGRAEGLSHELYGHGLLYHQYRDRNISKHDYIGSKDNNALLRRYITRARKETISYFK